MFASVTSVVLVGVDPRPVRVEAHISNGRGDMVIVGLPDTAVREARERVKAAMRSSGIQPPSRRIVVNLSPADVPKAGSAYDLPIALSVLAAARYVPADEVSVVALGELGLDGSLRPVRGGFAAAVVARDLGLRCVLPPSVAAEARSLEGVKLLAAASLQQVLAVLTGKGEESPIPPTGAPSDVPVDLAEVRGQAMARRALEVAAAGGHHLFMSGPPGAGKTLLARCLPGLLPPLTAREQYEVALVWTAAGRPRPAAEEPPFRAPHHTASGAAMIGGGSGLPVPGELSLAHRGVLFLDELGEFPPHLLDSMRQPLEDRYVLVARKGVSVRFPTAVQCVAATNPCPCGYRGDRLVSCRCTPRGVERYRRRLSGPLLDRFDLGVSVGRVDAGELTGPGGESSAAARARVAAARKRQLVRGRLNRVLRRPHLDALSWAGEGVHLLTDALRTLGLSARGWDRVRRVAVSVADLAESDVIAAEHVAEALAYRKLP